MVDRQRDFISGFAASVELHNRAGNIGAFVESVRLGTTIIDASLRVGLMLKHQLNTHSEEVLDEC